MTLQYESENPPSCWDPSLDGWSLGPMLNRATIELQKKLFAEEHPTPIPNPPDPMPYYPYYCPDGYVTYTSSRASCFREVWTIVWYTYGLSGGGLIMHTHDVEIGKSNRYDEYGHYTNYYQNLVAEYISALGGSVLNTSVYANWFPCSDYCCIEVRKFCFDLNTWPEVTSTVLNYYPSNQNCPTNDEQCYIQTCQ